METLGLLTSTNKYQNLQTMVTPPPPSHLSSLVYLIVGQSWMRLFVFCLFLNLFLNFDSRICHTLLSSWCKIKMSTEISIKYIWRTRKFWGSNNCYHCKHLTSFKKKKAFICHQVYEKLFWRMDFPHSFFFDSAMCYHFVFLHSVYICPFLSLAFVPTTAHSLCRGNLATLPL